MAKGKNDRTPGEIEESLRKITELYLRGWSLRRIGDEMGLHHTTILAHLKKIREEWKAEALKNVDDLQSRELAKLDKAESTYWDAWDRSFAGGKAGKHEYLDGILKTIDRRCKLLGLDAPVKLEHGGAFAQMLSAAASGGFEAPPPFPKPEQPEPPADTE